MVTSWWMGRGADVILKVCGRVRQKGCFSYSFLGS